MPPPTHREPPVMTNPGAERVKSVRALSRRSVRARTGRFLAEGPQSVREAVVHHPEQVRRPLPHARRPARATPTSSRPRPRPSSTCTRSPTRCSPPCATRPPRRGSRRSAASSTADPRRGARGRPRLLVLLTHVRDPGNAGHGHPRRRRGRRRRGARERRVGRRALAQGGAVDGRLAVPPAGGHRAAGRGDAWRRLRAAGIRVLAADGAGDDPAAARSTWPGPHAWVMGNEAWGLSAPRCATCATRSSACPIYGKAESLNLAMAATVCLYASAGSTQPLRSAPWTSRPGMLMDNESAGIAAELIPRRPGRRGRRRPDPVPQHAAPPASSDGPREELVGADIREAVDLQDSDGTSWWAVTDPWGGLRIRTGHREKLLMLRHNGREVLVTAKYLRPGRNQPVNRVNILDARRGVPPPRRGRERRRHLDRRPRAALAADLGQGLLVHPAAPVGPVHRRPEAADARDHRGRRRPRHPADHRAARRLADRLRPAADPAPADRRLRRVPPARRAGGGQWPRATTGSPSRSPTSCPRCGPTPTGSTRSCPTSSRTPSATATAWSPWRPSARPTTGQAALEAKGHHAAGVDLLVADEGKGIAADHRHLVFSRFWHGPGAAAPASGSTSSRDSSRRTAAGSRSEDATAGGAQFRISLPSEPPDYLA